MRRSQNLRLSSPPAVLVASADDSEAAVRASILACGVSESEDRARRSTNTKRVANADCN